MRVLVLLSALAGFLLLGMAVSVLRSGLPMPSPMAHQTPSQKRLPWSKRLGYSVLYSASGLALLALIYASLIRGDITAAHAVAFAANHDLSLGIALLCVSIGIFLFCWPDQEARLLERSYPQLSEDPKILPALLTTIQLIGVGAMLMAAVILTNLRE